MTSSTTNTFQSCCLTSFQWNGKPSGREDNLAGLPIYITGNDPSAAVLYVHDALGWKFNNARLLADRYAQEANVTVYLSDFFGGEELDAAAILEGRWQDLDIVGFKKRNSREIREPEIFAVAKELRSKGHSKLGAVTEKDFDSVGVLVMFLAPEKDAMFPDELKEYAFETLLSKKSVSFAWIHFPGVAHGCMTKGDKKVEGERKAMAKGKGGVVELKLVWVI